METVFLTDSPVFTWVILPLLIFLARIMDVSIGTLRLIFVSKGYKFYAPMLGFFEVIIWLLAIGQIMQHLDNFMCYLAYGLGFAAGNYIGIYFEEKLSLGTVLIRVVSKSDTSSLINRMREENFGASLVDIEGMTGKQKMIFTIVKRIDLKDVMRLIQEYNPQAFVTIEDVKTAQEGYFRLARKRSIVPLVGLFLDFRKGK
jgi:uncharacterized protein YebE (UPF0316 family)